MVTTDNRLAVIYLTLFLGIGLHAQETSPTIAFMNVTLVPLDTERVVAGQTVLIRGDKIEAISPADDIELPAGTVEIDGTGKFLMPGLADMHVHIFSADELPIYLANGVTTVRNMWGWSMHLDLRDRIERGELLGPRIYTAGALIDGNPPRLRGSATVETAEQAEAVVAQQVSDGYDFLKVYDGLTPEAYTAVLAAAGRAGVPVAGHVPKNVSFEAVLASGQASIEHMWGYPAAAVPKADSVTWSSKLATRRLKSLARATRQAGVWSTPTLVVLTQQDISAEESRQFLVQSELDYLPSFFRRFCCSQPYDEADDLAPEERERRADNRNRMVRELHRAGARLLLGTDTGNPLVIPGYAVHEELRLLVTAGLSPYEAISAGTRWAAEFMGAAETWGTVAVGRQADLILTNANPLEDISTIATHAGVMVRGQWLDRDEIAAQLAELVAKQSRGR